MAEKSKSATEQWEALQAVEYHGITVPDLLKDILQQAYWKEQGVKEVYECPKCSGITTLFFHAKSFECCGYVNKPLWKASS